MAESLNPDIRCFMRQLAADYALHPAIATADVNQQRRIAAAVRARWTVGGPIMHATHEIQIPFRGQSIRARLYYPTQAAPRPLLVYAHGGGWTLFSIETHDRLMREYAARAGMVVAGVDYSLAPETKFPIAVHELVSVVRWLRRHGAELGIDADRVAVGGDSAGANLSVAACLLLREEAESDAVSAMVLNYGAFDIDLSSASWQRFGSGEFLLSVAETLGFWNNYLRSPADADDPLACPLHARLDDLPPAFMAVAEIDPLYDSNIAMAARLRSAGVSVEAIVYPGTVHGFLEAVSIARISEQALSDTARWLMGILQPVP